MSVKELIAGIKPKPVKVKIPSWGDVEVMILPPTRAFLDQHDQSLKAAQESDDDLGATLVDLMYETVAKALCEDDGSIAFDDVETFRAAIAEAPFDGISELYQCVTRSDVRKASMVKSAAKNSKTRR
jgi:hypothetical protein